MSNPNEDIAQREKSEIIDLTPELVPPTPTKRIEDLILDELKAIRTVLENKP